MVRCVPFGTQVLVKHHQEQPSRPLISARFDRKALVLVDLMVGWALLDPPFLTPPLIIILVEYDIMAWICGCPYSVCMSEQLDM